MGAKGRAVLVIRSRLWAARLGVSAAAALLAHAGAAQAADLTLTTSGRVSVELLTANADFRNTMALVSPTSGVVSRGCKLEPANGLPGVQLVSEKLSQRGCRIDLDADPATAGIQPFPSGTTLKFAMCAQFNSDANCEYVWNSDPTTNSDNFEHLRTTPIHAADFPGQIYQLAWEDQINGGDQDFNDLIATVRISKDSDGDGLWDDWEKYGIDTDGDGTVDLDLPALGAQVLHKDAFIEIDYMDCSVAGGDCTAGDTHSHRPKQAAIDAVVNAFRNAPVANPDGVTGISLHVDVSNSLAHQNALNLGCFTGGAGIGDFDTVKSDPANFGPTNPRRFAYHYTIFAHRQVPTTTSSGCSETGGNDFEVTLGGWDVGAGDRDGDGLADADVGTVQEQAGTLIHEFGHNLGLRHGGDVSTNYKPNYVGNMNYWFQFGVPPTDPDGAGPLVGRVDYSQAVLAQLDELNLDEAVGVGAGTDNSYFYCPNMSRGNITGSGPANWNCSGTNAENGIQADINGDRVCVSAGANGVLDTAPAGDDVVLGTRIVDGPDRTCQTAPSGDDAAERAVNSTQVSILTGYDDWNSLQFVFQAMGSFDDGDTSARPLGHRSIDATLYEQELVPELSISIQSPSPTIPGTQVTLDVVVLNPRPVGARDVTVSILLPTGLALVSCSATNGGTCGGSPSNPTVTFAGLGGGEGASISLTGLLNCAAPVGTTLPVTAQVAHSRPDPDPSNDIYTAQVPVLGRTPVDAMMGFEDAYLWHSSEVTPVLSMRAPTQGCHAVDVPGSGYRTLTNRQVFSTPLSGTTGKLALDLFIPSGQPNPAWMGAVQMFASCPSGNMNNAYIGQVEITGMPQGAYSTLVFPIPAPIRAVLGTAHPDCSLSVAVNTNPTPTSPTLDNLRFVP